MGLNLGCSYPRKPWACSSSSSAASVRKVLEENNPVSETFGIMWSFYSDKIRTLSIPVVQAGSDELSTFLDVSLFSAHPGIPSSQVVLAIILMTPTWPLKMGKTHHSRLTRKHNIPGPLSTTSLTELRVLWAKSIFWRMTEIRPAGKHVFGRITLIINGCRGAKVL